MLFYIRCPSCGRTISENLDKYFEGLEAILDHPRMTKIEKEQAQSKLLDEFEYTEICCRSRIMGLVPAHKIIVT
jgi:DNA-directed RNA polymerase subunit N (RpoN/RPB10)